MRAAAVVTAIALAFVACKKSPPASSGTGTAGAADPWAGSAGSAAPAPSAIDKPFLYAVTHPQSPGVTSYLLGTMHIGVDAERQLPPWVWARLDGAKAFAMEADVSNPALMTALQRTDGSTLQAELGPDHWTKLKAVIGDRLAEGMNGMKPFAAMTVLATKDLPLTPPMDQVMHAKAKDAGKEIVFLESALRQLEIIDPFMTAADVKAYLDNLDYAKGQSQTMIEAYRSGDEAALRRMFEDQTLWKAAGRDPATYQAYLDAILGQRNAAWIEPIEKLHAGGGGFIAVGAGHLVGPRSVVELLTQKGYAVSRVTGP
ncbi:MAG TPA: TraB/GumN family protein [Kofleriaceae bacterium]|nr:TraB/GumN family protein [Kofleriaceae bacterium]